MMDFVTQPQLRDWLTAIVAERSLIAPVRVGDDLVLYQPVDSPDTIVYDFARTIISPKEFFLPATETILTVEEILQQTSGEGDGSPPAWDVSLTDHDMERDHVLFGVRPCDAHALLAMDALLLQEPVDVYYARRRRRATLIGLACEKMGPTCFCTSVGLAPDDHQGMDVMLYPVENGYALEVLTEKGQAITSGLSLESYQWETPTREWPHAEFDVPPRTVWLQLFDDPYWSELADRCLGCKLCAYVCPTCRCFDVRDKTVVQSPGYQKIERLRCWDSCMVDVYRRIAGGHDPRPDKAQRLRNRFYCKFDYYPTDFGPMACVGCGRCIDVCPVNVDITEVLEAVKAKGKALAAEAP